MDKFLVVLGFFIAFSVSAMGQETLQSDVGVLSPAHVKAQIKLIEKANQKLFKELQVSIPTRQDLQNEMDRYLSLPKDTGTGEWVTTVLGEYDYKADGLLLKNEVCFPPAFGEFSPYRGDEKFEMVYDAENRVIQKLVYRTVAIDDTDGCTFRIAKKLHSGYDALGNLSYEIEESYGSDDRKAEDRFKTDYEYDEDNRCIAKVASIAIDESPYWKNTMRNEFVFNELGQLITNIRYSWRGNAWYYEAKDETEYDAKGHKSQIQMYVWRYGKWEIYRKEQYRHYNEEQLYLEARYDWNDREEKWELYEKTEKDFDMEGRQVSSVNHYKGTPRKKELTSYDENGKQVLYEYFAYENNDWLNTGRTIQAYNREGKEVFCHRLYWNYDANRLVTRNKTETFYNSEGREIMKKEYGVDDSYNDFLKSKNVILRDKRKKYKDYEYDIHLDWNTDAADWEVSCFEVNVYNGENLINHSRYNTDNEVGTLLCYYRILYHYDPSNGQVVKIVLNDKEDTGDLKVYDMTVTSYVDYHNKEKEVSFISTDVLSIGVEVKEKRRVAKKSICIMEDDKWVVLRGIRNYYDQNKQLVQTIGFGRGKME